MNKHSSFLAEAALLVVVLTAVSSTQTADCKGAVKVLILAGQSNMERFINDIRIGRAAGEAMLRLLQRGSERL